MSIVTYTGRYTTWTFGLRSRHLKSGPFWAKQCNAVAFLSDDPGIFWTFNLV